VIGTRGLAQYSYLPLRDFIAWVEKPSDNTRVCLYFAFYVMMSVIRMLQESRCEARFWGEGIGTFRQRRTRQASIPAHLASLRAEALPLILRERVRKVYSRSRLSTKKEIPG
jgi:hypothetical protein